MKIIYVLNYQIQIKEIEYYNPNISKNSLIFSSLNDKQNVSTKEDSNNSKNFYFKEKNIFKIKEGVIYIKQLNDGFYVHGGNNNLIRRIKNYHIYKQKKKMIKSN